LKKSCQKALRRREDGLPFKRGLGQHFLYDRALLASLVASTGVTKADNVLEIGPGSGMLTACLCEAAGRVLAVEVDESLLPFLRAALAPYSNAIIVQGDIRRLPLQTLCAPLGQGFFVIANIPYHLTSPILDLLLGTGLPIRQVSVMVQQEVADKLLAAPGAKDYGLLSLKAQFYCEPALAIRVPAAAFTPPPKVDSAFMNLPFRQAQPWPVTDERLLFRLMKAGFGQRRKTMVNALHGALPLGAAELRGILAELGLPAAVRGEALSLREWIYFANACHEKGNKTKTGGQGLP